MKRVDRGIAPYCMECGVNQVEWSYARGENRWKKFCSRICHAKSANKNSNYYTYVKQQRMPTGFFEYFEKNIKDNSLVRLEGAHPEFVGELIHRTNFLPEDCSLSQRIAHISNDSIMPMKKCYCGNDVVWVDRGYSTFCSMICSSRSDDTKRKVAETMTEKYGNSSYTHTSLYKSRILDDVGILYSYDNIDEVYEQYKKDKKEARRPLTYEEKTGYKHQMFNPKVVKQVMYKKGLNKYGEELYTKLNDVEYLRDQHYNKKKNMSKLAEEMGVSLEVMMHQFDRLGIERKVFYQSNDEKEIHEWLTEWDVPFKPSVRNLTKQRYEYDIVSYDKKIAIEYCGLFWHSISKKKIKEYHYNKWKAAYENGYKLITIFQNEFKYSKKRLVNMLHDMTVDLSNEIVHITKISPTDFNSIFLERSVRNSLDASYFCKVYSGDSNLYLAYDIINSENVAIKSVCGMVYDSRLWEQFVKYTKIESNTITIELDLRWDDYSLFSDILGFEFIEFIECDWYYTRNAQLWNKDIFYETYLSKQKTFVENESFEWNLKKHNINKIYDCGKVRMILR